MLAVLFALSEVSYAVSTCLKNATFNLRNVKKLRGLKRFFFSVLSALRLSRVLDFLHFPSFHKDRVKMNAL